MQNQPHDRFFKQLFSNKQMAIEYFEQFLPAQLSQILAFDQLEITKDSYINQKLEGRYSDIVYTCILKEEKKPVRICLLLEHKSLPEELPHFQLLRYMLNGWELQIKQKQELQPIIPILFYHGEQSWVYKEFKDYFDYENPILDQYLPRFEYHLTDLTQYSDRTILQLKASFLINALITFKHARDLNFLHQFVDLILGLQGKADTGLQEAFFVYFSRISEFTEANLDELRTKLSESPNQDLMSTYDNIINKGFKQGLEQGIEQGLEQGIEQGYDQGLDRAIAGLLRKGATVQFIADALNLPIERVQKVKDRLTKS